MNPSVSLLIALLLPMVAIPIIALLGKRPNLREGVTLTTGGLLFLNAINLVGPLLDGQRPMLVLAEMLPGLSLTLELEPLGLLFALLASGLWIITSLYAIGYMRSHQEQNQTRFYAFFALAIGAVQGVALAGNLLTLFIFYEILTFATYPLVTHHGTPEAQRRGRIYLGILLGTSFFFLLLAIILTWHLTGTLDFRAGGILAGQADGLLLGVLLALYAFGIGKAALMPFHRWLPAAMVAPTPVSALLHAVAVVKAGVFAILKVVVYVFGLDLLNETNVNTWLVYVAGGTIIVASLVALTQDNLKARLAYSTIGQLSYIVMGAALANGWGVIGGSLHIVAHAFAKITLFFCAGAIMAALHKNAVSQMKGIGRQMPLTMTAFFIASVSIIGLPPTGGMWSKWFLILGGLEAEQYVAVGILMLSSLLSISYLIPIVVNAFFFPAQDDAGVKEAPTPCIIALTLTALGCMALFLYPDPLQTLLRLMGVF